MFILLLKHWNGHKPGRIFDMADGAANVLIKRGVAKAERGKRKAEKKNA